MKKKTHMSEPVSAPVKRKGDGLRQFVFAMMITTAAALTFFPSGQLADGPVTQFTLRLIGQWDDAIERTAHSLPHAHSGD